MPLAKKKPLARNVNLILTIKRGLERTINELEKQFRRNPIPKIEKPAKPKVKLPHVNKKTTSVESNCCSNTVFSL